MYLYWARVEHLLQRSLEASQTCSPEMRASVPWQDKCDLLRWQVTPPTCFFFTLKFNFLDSFFPPIFGDSLVSFLAINQSLLSCNFSLEIQQRIAAKMCAHLLFLKLTLQQPPYQSTLASFLKSWSLLSQTKLNTSSLFPSWFHIQHHSWSLPSSLKLP